LFHTELWEYNTPLPAAARRRHLPFLLSGSDKDTRLSYYTPLHAAARRGHTQLVQLLLDSGGDKDARTDAVCTPLYLAAQEGHSRVVEILLTAGAHMNAAKNDGATPIFVASQNGHDSVVQLLLAAGADMNAAMDDGETPLCVASRYGHHRVVELLLAAGAAVNAPLNDGATPISMASKKGYHSVVELLLAAGADINAAMNDGETPIFEASRNGHHSVVELLLAADATFNIQDNIGHSPLFLASLFGHPNVVEMLLDRGADPNISNIHGTSVLDSTQQPSCRDSLRKRGALSSSELAVRRLSNDTGLECLPIDCSKLSPSDASSLTSLLAAHETITSLSLYRYNILSSDTTLLRFNQLFAQSNLPCSLKIEVGQFSSESFAKIIDGIILNEKITSLDLKFCRIQNLTAHLSRLLQQSSSLVSLKLRYADLSTDVAIALGNALQYNTTLTFLDLSRNPGIKYSEISYLNDNKGEWHIQKNMSLYQLLIPVLKDFDDNIEIPSLKRSSHPTVFSEESKISFDLPA
jgi:ankyrin repeat protein